MAQKSGNHVKPPVSGGNGTDVDKNGSPTTKQNLTEQHHGESTKSFQDDKRIGQHNGTGRPPLMEK